MQFLVYILVYPLLWLISILPFRLLYLFSYKVYIILYYIVGYRKKTVTENLKLVFPEKSEKEIATIRKKFYRHLCDMFLEMVKTMTISETELKKRFKILNPEELKRLESLNKSIILIFGHYASWEWSIVIQQYINFKGLAVYKPLANSYFDRLVKNIRSKFNTDLISTKETISIINDNEAKGVKSITGFLSDQSPRLTKEVYWGEFMGINVPCFTGAERLAKKLDLTTAYLKVNKVKRGYYEAEIITLAEDPKIYKDYELTDMFLREVEKQIYEAPEYYFWTHKRWKHRHKK
ncbi:lysophospholipid acyltransferase family protein [Flavobacteriaceae bacterium XHP0103]|uniref:lysophospholipid acyltransferase family protein n=1 Tax=Marixanthotalea marina TaxID=2844359 RepID=UPI002989A87B|nr:lysophospholipid acyltransferase family protein [Marixanthotalea marina]MBU3822982.1 lysophospholipid acyltransferase family protein [Marixanthotalea marina]